MTLDNISFYEQMKKHIQMFFKPVPQVKSLAPEKIYKDKYDYIKNSSLEDFEKEYVKCKDTLSDGEKIAICDYLLEGSNDCNMEKIKILVHDIDKRNIHKMFMDSTLKKTTLSAYLLEKFPSHIELDSYALRIIFKRRPELLSDMLKNEKVIDLLKDQYLSQRLTDICLQNGDSDSITLLLQSGMPATPAAERLKSLGMYQKLESDLATKPVERKTKI